MSQLIDMETELNDKYYDSSGKVKQVPSREGDWQDRYMVRSMSASAREMNDLLPLVAEESLRLNPKKLLRGKEYKHIPLRGYFLAHSLAQEEAEKEAMTLKAIEHPDEWAEWPGNRDMAYNRETEYDVPDVSSEFGVPRIPKGVRSKKLSAETKSAQQDALREWGVDLAQEWFEAKPKPDKHWTLLNVPDRQIKKRRVGQKRLTGPRGGVYVMRGGRRCYV